MKNISQKNGFTLIELLVVISIIGVLATIVLGSLSDARARARDAKRLADIRTIQLALEIYNLDNGIYPPSTGLTGGQPNSPNASWAHSAYTSWENLGIVLGTTLPVDPLNEEGFSSSNAGPYNYAYFRSITGCPAGSAYFISVKLESGLPTAAQNPGVKRCTDGATYYYGSGVTAGASPLQ